MNSPNPIISIITVTYQAAQTLERTIMSVLSQEVIYEYIIIDGGSNDTTLEIIEKYKDSITYWISEPDTGIYHAMNKGIDHSKGDWIYFLGADDELLPSTLLQVRSYLNKKYAVVYGDICYNTGEKIISFLNSRTLLQNTLHHQGTFYNKSLFDNFRYDTNLSILSDYELNLLIYRSKLPTFKLQLTIACCEKGGASSDLSLSLRETNLVRSRYVYGSLLNKLLSITLRVYYLQKEFRAHFKWFLI